MSTKGTLGKFPVDYANKSAGGDLPIVVADPTTPGQKLAIDASGRITVLGSGTFTIAGAVTNAVLTALSKAEDSVHTDGDTGIQLLTVRRDTPVQDAGTAGDYSHIITDANGLAWMNLGALLAGENQTDNRLYGGSMGTPSAEVSADAQIKAGAGKLLSVTLSSDAAATAGTLILYDSLTETGTILKTLTFIAAYFTPVTLFFNCSFSTGLYAGFTTTGDVTATFTII